ncbi:TniB family NTP-binding protein [Loktanella salsilacus]|jgi:hypothetical protein|uniref:TniB family NTP-binding protein n=1 Tax=Loktanella salsilacus TaxID=195913 RepID=UPI0020B6EF06|nr:TniB family NTP-binding protein [Loktanella salsilacus]UTH48863.1 TniB family NTP-binding protein [Loktanella salsilacus]
MTSTKIKTSITPVQRRAFLKSKYFKMARAEELDARLRAIVDDFDAGKLSGERLEGQGLVVIGESGSGKSTEIDKALERFLADGSALECGLEKLILQVALDGETTWKALGLQVLTKLGYPLATSRTEHEIWERVRSQLEGQGIWLLHIDECQHMFETLGEKETRKVINSIKTLMKHREWPVIVILSGIPDLLAKVNLDPQLRNLMTPYSLNRLDPRSDDLHEIDSVIYEMAEALGLDISGIRTEETYLRICYGQEHLYGKIFKFIVNVFSALPSGETMVTVSHLAGQYECDTGCMPGHNVFLRADYESCNVQELMADY